MTEHLLQYLWNYKIFNTFDFKDTEGNALEILDFGTWNTHAGADFQYAKIKTQDITFSGHIELHLRSSDWDLHQHSQDFSYHNVILHAVYEHDRDIDFLKNKNIPTLELKNYIDREIIERYQKLSQLKRFIPCEDLFSAQYQSINFHEENVIRKLNEKATEIEQQLVKTKNDYEAVLFHRMAYGFGLKVNAEIFQSIAESLDFSVFRKLCQNITQLEAFFLGRAGLLDQAEDAQSQLWKREYQFVKQKFSLQDITFPPKFLRLRPPNFPTLRLSQLSQVYHRSPSLFSMIMEAKSYQDLKNIFVNISASEYWDSHYQIGKVSEKSQSKKLSSNFIDILILNVILPIKYTYHRNNDENMQENILKIYKQIPSEENSIIDEWKSLGCVVENALHSQSYLYQYKTFCLRKKCLNCDAGKKILKK